MLTNLGENSEENFPQLLDYSVVRISLTDDAFSRILEREERPVEGQQLQQKDKKRRKIKGIKNAMLVDRTTCSHANTFWSRLELIFMLKMSKKRFCQKAPGVNGLNALINAIFYFNFFCKTA